jgi:alkylhydroperoxidase family enzyme
MSRIDIPTPDQIPEGSKQILDTMTRQLHLTPNLFKIMALSPNALNGWAGLQGALAKTLDAKTLDAKTLDAKTRDDIALAVSQVNGCHYCLSEHGMGNVDGAPDVRDAER